MTLLPTVACASDEPEVFIEANLLAIFYPAPCSALIDLEDIAILGQDEDAADAFSIFLVDAHFEETAAQAVAFEAAYGFLGEAFLRDEETDEIPWWDVHGPVEQCNDIICILFGSAPNEREELALDLGLPQERAEYCPEEFEPAPEDWCRIMDEIRTETCGASIRLRAKVAGSDTLTFVVVAKGVRTLNEDLPQSETLRVSGHLWRGQCHLGDLASRF